MRWLSWGSDQYGQASGRVDERDEDLLVPVEWEAEGIEGEVAEVQAGGSHSLVRLASGRLLSFGSDACGQLGRSTKSDRNVGQVEVDGRASCAAAGHAHSLMIDVDGVGYAWGGNRHDECLPTLSAAPHSTDMHQSPIVSRPTRIFPASTEPLVRVAAGVRHSLACTASGRVLAWGCNQHGQLELESALTAAASLRSSPESWQEAVRAGHYHFYDVAAGRQHSAALVHTPEWSLLLAAGRLPGYAGVEAIPRTGGRWHHVSSGWSHVAAVSVHADHTVRVRVLGRDRFGQGSADGLQTRLHLPVSAEAPTTPRGMLHVRCGAESTLLVDADGRVFACGWNEHGNLGCGDRRDRHCLTPVTALRVRYAAEEAAGVLQRSRPLLSAGGAHVVAVGE
ncbi:hypothetical protein CDCA_CDCA01G0424 [Cyanidium caldarium]|uniref:RCC1-like domain-containing protein n=1 Tax=Cyanidium caldarium TaxID=2771 RepID=A0AAV9IQ80_CYACA|nr:hypothetical protein CDCA_CDCA01G0424 [Cyanidium caldarium]